jgi:hypothetical protein
MTKKLNYQTLMAEYSPSFDKKKITLNEDKVVSYNEKLILSRSSKTVDSLAVIAEWNSEGKMLDSTTNLFSFPDFTMKTLFLHNEDSEKSLVLEVPYSSQTFEREELAAFSHTEREHQIFAFEMGLALWQFCYFATHSPLNPAECAYSHRVKHNVCHACYGEGFDPKATDTKCYICHGTGSFDHSAK